METRPELRTRIPWTLDTAYCHHGMPLSNGVFGALVWFGPAGSDGNSAAQSASDRAASPDAPASQHSRIRITINRGDYWDRRGETEWTEQCSYDNIRRLAQEDRVDEIRALFKAGRVGNTVGRPTRLPLGRLEIDVADDRVITAAELDLAAGEVRVLVGESTTIRVRVLYEAPLVVVAAPNGTLAGTRLVPARDFPAVADAFAARAIPPQRPLTAARPKQSESTPAPTLEGFVQEIPENPSITVAAGKRSDAGAETLLVAGAGLDASAAARGGDEAGGESARRPSVPRGYPGDYRDHDDRPVETVVVETLERLAREGYAAVTRTTEERWRELMEQTAAVDLGDIDMERMYALGVYKMLGNSMPGRVAPSLQGPWVEEHRMPPWSSDYHFNINVQECLWAAYPAGHLDALEPIFSLVASWKPVLRERARIFVGVENGLQLNHAVDDRGMSMGGFWTGAVDPANTSWMAQLMWLSYRYSGDTAFLAEYAVPFLIAAFRVFRGMMEDDGTVYRIPLSISPEYGAEGDDAWGVNSSFFLANVHFLCETLERCRAVLPQHSDLQDEALFREVADVRERLPRYTAGRVPGDAHISGPEIFLWENQHLAHSHRHHSHLAGIHPFDVIDPADPEHAEVVRQSYRRWTRMGMGEWSGWSMPWASILHGRLGSPEMAVLSLRIFREIFTMPGYSTRHNSNGEGFTVLSGGDIMQLEAASAYSAAILELFVHTVRGRLRFFSGIPASMPDVAFRGIHTEGGFVVSGRRRDRSGGSRRQDENALSAAPGWIRIRSIRGEELRVEVPWPQGARLIREAAPPPDDAADPGPDAESPATHGGLLAEVPGSSTGDGPTATAGARRVFTAQTENGASYLLLPT